MAGTVNAGDKLIAATLGVPPWTAMTLINSWGNFGSGNVVAQYRKWVLLNSVEIIGCISRSPVSPLPFFTLPAGFIPATQQQTSCATVGGSSATNMCYVQCDTSGNLTVQQVPTGATTYIFHGWISLDA